jgi:chemotaxis family two-component system response regulator Rcp1
MTEGTDMNEYVNAHVGALIHERRKKCKITLEALAEKLGISYQQVWKYENGESRIPLHVLYKLSRILGVDSVQYFFEGLKESEDGEGGEGVPLDDTIALINDRPLKIAIVEDDSVDAMILQKAVGACPVPTEVFLISDGEQAIDILVRKKNNDVFFVPDIIFLDIDVPKYNGIEILKRLKHDSEAKATPVIMVTNSVNRGEMVQCYQTHAGGYIPKSFNFEVFKAYISNTINYWAKCVALPTRN